jgi:hypothetical protein
MGNTRRTSVNVNNGSEAASGLDEERELVYTIARLTVPAPDAVEFKRCYEAVVLVPDGLRREGGAF